jgi:predicted metal-dependent hydrolase
MSIEKGNGAPETLESAVPAAVVKSEVEAWAKRIGVEPKEIHIRPMKRKWASCSSRGRMTMDTGLLQQPAEFRREVIIHELVHLKVPNHGKLFSSLVKAYAAGSRLGETQITTNEGN